MHRAQLKSGESVVVKVCVSACAYCAQHCTWPAHTQRRLRHTQWSQCTGVHANTSKANAQAQECQAISLALLGPDCCLCGCDCAPLCIVAPIGWGAAYAACPAPGRAPGLSTLRRASAPASLPWTHWRSCTCMRCVSLASGCSGRPAAGRPCLTGLDPTLDLAWPCRRCSGRGSSRYSTLT